MRCWAFNQVGQRCDIDSREHDAGMHSFTIYWSDEETYTPSGVPNTPVFVAPLSPGPWGAPTGSPGPGYVINEDGMAVLAPAPAIASPEPVDKCAACGCPSGVHDTQTDEYGSKIGCQAHQCKTYVPGG